MIFFHLSDLHLGKRLAEFSLLEDQKYILGQIISLTAQHRPDAIVIAGDIYDKSQPSAEAVALFDDFLCRAADIVPHIVVISGNHDSPERLSFGSRLMNMSGVMIAPVFGGAVTPLSLTDEYGEIDIWPLPFLRASTAAHFYPDTDIYSANDAIASVIADMRIDASRRNVLVCHQFVNGASVCDSEDVLVGGTDAVDVKLFDAFDYTALGHIHSPQNIIQNKVRYCGTPLKYSVSEITRGKTLTKVTLGVKGDVSVEELALTALHDMRTIRGSFAELTEKHITDAHSGDYISLTLTDELEIPDAAAELRKIYPNLMRLDYDNTRSRSDNVIAPDKTSELSPQRLCEDFYETQNGAPVSCCQSEYLTRIIHEIWEEM